METTASERARQGRKFATAAHEYDQGRPGWPAAVLEAAAAGLGLTPGATVADVGAGTGKLTRRLVDRFARVIAVEPLDPLRELLTRHLPEVDARAGTAEALPLGDGEVDAVFVAEAFHWFDGGRALAEAARVLRPGGGIALLWNHPAGPWQPALPDRAGRLITEAIARGGEPGGPRLRRGEWRDAFAGSPFGEPRVERVAHELVLDRAGLVANALSVSSIAGLPAPEREELRQRLSALIPEGVYRQPLRAELYWARCEPARWCDRCGGARERPDDHAGCDAARTLEPPRFCARCRRRMKVQVLPSGWTAICVAHGEVRATGDQG